MNSSLAGTTSLFALIIRRDRIRLPVWLFGLGGVIAASAAAVPPLYDTPEKIAGYASAVGSSPVGYLMSGRQAGIDTIGGIVANEISQVAQLGICLMVMFLVVRHTRAEEESGRSELLRSTVSGRHAATVAALAYAVLAAVLIGAVTTAAMVLAGIEATGSVTYGAGLTLLGVSYAALAVVAAQLATSARGALGLAGAAIALGYLVRGIGALQDTALTWASPFGWAQQMNAFGTERWWPALLLLAWTAALLTVAAALTSRRDFGGGLLQVRPGRPRATRALGTPVGLALRLQRGLVIGWAIGMGALGLLYGAVVPTIPDLIESNPEMAEMFGASSDAKQALLDAFVGYVFVFMAVLSTGFVVAAVLRSRSEEESGRAELLLSTSVPRTRLMAATVVVAGGGALVISLCMGLGLAVGYGLGLGEWNRFGVQLGQQLSYLPAVLVVAAVAVGVVGLWPRWAMAAWVVLALVVLQVILGQTLQLPDWVQGMSPFWHLPRVPEESFSALPGVIELALAFGLALLGLWGYRRRDIGSA